MGRPWLSNKGIEREYLLLIPTIQYITLIQTYDITIAYDYLILIIYHSSLYTWTNMRTKNVSFHEMFLFLVMQTLHLSLFGITRDIVGNNRLSVSLENPSVETLLSHLKTTYPRLGQISSLLVAVNSDYAEPNQLLKATDEIALIPPVSGG